MTFFKKKNKGLNLSTIRPNGVSLSLQVKDLVKLGLLTLMIRTFYYLIGIYFYLDLVGGIWFSTSFDQFFDWLLSGFWVLSCIMKSFLVIYDIS